MSERDEAVNLIRGLGNDKAALDIWKKLMRYGRRSLVETFFSRMKQKFGSRIQSKTIDRQWVEVGLKLRLLNQEMSAATNKN